MISDIFCTFTPVNQKVVDISKVLLGMTEEIRLMRETIDSQHSEICRLSRLVESNRIELYKRGKRIEELEAKLLKYEALFSDFAKDNNLLHQLIDLALLQNGMLKGEALSKFIKRSVEML